MRRRLIILAVLSVAILSFYFLIAELIKSKDIYRLPYVLLRYRFTTKNTVEVEEEIHYLMVKPYRGIYYDYYILGHPILDNVKVLVDGSSYHRISWLQKTDKRIRFRVYLSEGGNRITPSKKGDLIKLTVKYTILNPYELGKDFVQFFNAAIWRDGWSQKVEKMEIYSEYPYEHYDARFSEKLVVLMSHIYPLGLEKSREMLANGEKIILANVPANTRVGMRVLLTKEVFDPQVLNEMVKLPESLASIQKRDARYTLKARSLTLLIFTLPAVFPLLMILVYFIVGREPKVSYQGIYEREIPYNDPPEEVNAIVKRYCSSPDEDGFSAAILKLVKEGALEFILDGLKAVGLKIRDARKVKENDEILVRTLFDDTEISTGTEMYFDDLKEEVKKDQNRAKKFVENYRAWKELVSVMIKPRRYFTATGYYLTILIGIISFITGVMYLYIIATKYLSAFSVTASQGAWFLAPFLWILGVTPFVLPKDIFGRWTVKGREYYLKWKAFEKFLKDFSLISSYPPSSIVLWEDYLVYGTALGIAEIVARHMTKLVPKEWERDSHIPAPIWYDITWYATTRRLYGHALSHTAQQTSGIEGESSFGGGGGGFSGGGGGGAF